LLRSCVRSSCTYNADNDSIRNDVIAIAILLSCQIMLSAATRTIELFQKKGAIQRGFFFCKGKRRKCPWQIAWTFKWDLRKYELTNMCTEHLMHSEGVYEMENGRVIVQYDTLEEI
jgi:hypothetical protein